MPVGLSVVETIEEALCDAGLITELESLRRVIDFAKGEFSLRWEAGPPTHRSISVQVQQQLAQRQAERAIVVWQVQVDDSEEFCRQGRTMLESPVRPTGLARSVTGACEELIAAVRDADRSEPEEVDSPS